MNNLILNRRSNNLIFSLLICLTICLFANLLLPNAVLAAGTNKWVKTTPKFNGAFIQDIVFGNGTFITVTSIEAEGIYRYNMYTSKDGINWAKVGDLRLADNAVYPNISCANGMFYILDSQGRDSIFKSADGINWECIKPQYTGDMELFEEYKSTYCFTSIAYGNGIYVMAGDVGYNSQIVATSVDGLSWDIKDLSNLETPYISEHDGISSIIFAKGMFVAIGEDFSWKSTEGQTWQRIDLPGNGWIDNVVFWNDCFIAAGSNRILSSSDGANWSIIRSDESHYISRIIHDSEGLVAVGDGGFLLTSTDGINWIDESGVTHNHLFNIAAGNGKVLFSAMNNIYYSVRATESQTPISVYYKSQKLNSDVAPFIENGRVLIPFRTIFEALGMDVEWNQNAQKVDARNGQISLTLQPGQYQAEKVVNNATQIIALDVAPRIINARLFVPLRFVCEALDLNVSWDANERQVNIIKKGSSISNTWIKALNPVDVVPSKTNVEYILGGCVPGNQEDTIPCLFKLDEEGNVVFSKTYPQDAGSILITPEIIDNGYVFIESVFHRENGSLVGGSDYMSPFARNGGKS